jgi:predicted DNA-binding transcriptional regulator AlpA
MRAQGPPYTEVGRRLVRYALVDVEAWLAEYKQQANGSRCEKKAA